MPITDVLEQLFEFKWRDVSFPVTDFGTDIDHDQVAHEWPDRDGAHVEATGRKALIHHASIPFRSNISPGLSETWDTGGAVLYPTVFRNWLVAFTTRTTGPLQHPELGIINCKPKSARIRWQAKRRDGCDVEATWIESLDDTVTEFQDVLARSSPVPAATVASIDLDTQLVQYDDGAFVPPGPSFSEQIANITSAVDSVTLVGSAYAGQISAVTYQAQNLEAAVTALNDPEAWPIVNSCERLRSALYDMRSQMLTTQRSVFYYYPPADVSMASLVIPTQTSITDLLTLNPALATSPVIPAGTVVRYYAQGF